MDDVVGSERLVLVRLADVFVEGREEEVEKVLPQRRLVVDTRKDSPGDKIENFLKLLLLELADTLRVYDLVLQDDQFLRLVEALIEQSLQFRLDAGPDLCSSKALVGEALLQGEETRSDELPTNLLPDTVTVQQFVERIGTLDNGDTVVLSAEVEVDIFIHRTDCFLSGINVDLIDDARTILPNAHFICLCCRKNGNNLLRIRQLRLVGDVLLQLPHTVGDTLIRKLVLCLHKDNDFIAFEFDVSKLMRFVRMADKKFLVILSNVLQCFGITVFTGLKVADKVCRANRVNNLLSGHFSFLVRRRARGGEKVSGTHPVTHPKLT